MGILKNKIRQVFDMSYKVFKRKVKSIIDRAGGGISVRFSTDADEGKHYAHCSDGTTIIGNSQCLRVAVRWGSGHAGIATI